MFQELYDVAKHTPLTLAITPRGEKLHVMIIPRPLEGKMPAALSQPISALGTPAELDAELPAALLQYAQKVNDARTRIDLPIDALDGVTDIAPKKKATTPATPKPAAPRKPAKKAPEKSTAPRQPAAPKPTRPAKAAAPDTPPAAEKPDMPAASTTTRTPTRSSHGKPPKHPVLPVTRPKIDKATQAQCLDDGRDYLRRIGEAKPSRVLFIRFAKSGRRYEKMWSSFTAFMEAVRAQLRGGVPGNTGAGETKGPDAETKVAISETTPASSETPGAQVETSRTSADPAGEWPFPFPRVDGASGEPLREVVTEAGEVVGSSNFQHAIGDLYGSVMHPDHRVVEITEKRITIAAPPPPPPPPPATPVIRTVSTTTGTLLGSTMKKLAVGDTYTHEEFGAYRVAEITDSKVIVDRPAETPAGAADTRTADLVSQAVQERV